MTKFVHSKRSKSSKSHTVKAKSFTERNSSKDVIFQRQALADVCKIDVLKDFAKFTKNHLYRETILAL